MMTFDEVMKELQISEEALQQLVSELKIRAFRIKNTLQFQRCEVMAMKRQDRRPPGN
ncbi:MAG: helix-turn-helix domain-containing protein [Planctomycetes bacterium]|nr:helix-turn-helix domain-containing protein [Planctomycetota bacterium]